MGNYLPESEFTCARKVRYPDAQSGARAKREAYQRGAQWLRVYRCRFCAGYHLGHVTNWKSIQAWARNKQEVSYR